MRAKRVWFSVIFAACLLFPISSMGQVFPFDSLTRARIAALTIQDSVLNGSDSITNQIPVGTVAVYKTRNGYYGKLKVLKYGYNIAIRLITYNADGLVLAQADSLTIRGTFFCNLESATESSTNADFFWQQQTAVHRYVRMTSPAKVAIYSTPINNIGNFINFTFTPPSPGVLRNSQNVTVHFSYTTIANHGARIWCMPMTHGTISPGNAYQGSGVYNAGSDTSSRTFSISAGIVHVDSVDVLMMDSAMTTTLFETYVPVSYHFGSDSIYNIATIPPSPRAFSFGDTVKATFSYFAGQKVRFYAQPWNNGALTPNAINAGSGLYPAGLGSDSGRTWFSVTAGDVTVDSVRIRMYDSATTTLLKTFYVPVNYQFLANVVKNAVMSPPSPAALGDGLHVNLTFSYSTNSETGARIFVIPYTHGAQSPNYGVAGSPLYSSGSGAGTGFFTITTGTVAVDSIRIQLTNADQSSLLFQTFIPVQYNFSPTGVVPQKSVQVLPKEYDLTVTSSGRIRFALPSAGETVLRIYTGSGRCVATVLNGTMPAGYHQVQWTAAEGMYIARMEANGHSLTTPVMVVK